VLEVVRPLLVHPDPAPPELVATLDASGRDWTAVNSPDELVAHPQPAGWGGAIIHVGDSPAVAWTMAEAVRSTEPPYAPIILLVAKAQLSSLSERKELFDSFCLAPFDARELLVRLDHESSKLDSGDASADLVVYGELVLNVETYEAAIAGRALELTYMEYELLRYLASHPGRVFTREVLLSHVWGYDYFGGARTVDVHIRRLRSKLGEEHATMIQTVRSVGYSLGKSRWQA